MASSRRDSWAGKLLPDEVALCYERWTRSRVTWEEMAGWMADTYGVKKPSRTSFYEFFAPPTKEDKFTGGPAFRMYMAVRSAKIRAGGQQMAEFAKALKITDDQLAEGLKALGCDAVASGNIDDGRDLLEEFRKVIDMIIRRKDMEIRSRAQDTKDAELALERERFAASERRLDAVRGIADAARQSGGITEETLHRIEEAARLL